MLLKKIDTGVGSIAAPNGLATPSLLADGTRTIRTIYAGDLAGNLWKFDVSAPTPRTGPSRSVERASAPLFTRHRRAGVAQPITAPVEIGRHPDGGFMIYFGTGKFFETGDNIVGATPQVQTFYGIWDKRDAERDHLSRGRPRAVLTRQEILYEGKPAGSNFDVRVTTPEPRSTRASAAAGTSICKAPRSGAEGERVVSLPILRNGRVIFPTLIPSANPCEFGGSSWLMELDAVSGMRLEQPPLDITEDGEIDADDFVTVTIGGTTVTAAPSAVQSREGIIDTPAVIDSGTATRSRSRAARRATSRRSARAARATAQRGSWRQLR